MYHIECSEHSLVVKLQPSKLIMRVRFSLLALNVFSSKYFIYNSDNVEIKKKIYIYINILGVTKEEFLLSRLVKTCLVDLQGNALLPIF